MSLSCVKMSLSKTENAPVQDLNDSGCVQDSSVCESGYKRQAQLLDLSDDVLLFILKHCSPQDLKALGFTCTRLATLVCDHTLWQRVDCRDGSIGPQRLRWLLTHCLCDDTTVLKIKGYVNNKTRCLGIQDQSSPLPYHLSGTMSPVPEGARCNIENNPIFMSLLMRRNLPRYTVGPRWPDSAELANAGNVSPNTSNLSHSQKKMDEADSSAGEPVQADSNNLKQNEPTGSKCGTISSKHEPNSVNNCEPGSLNNVEPSGINVEPCSSKYVEPNNMSNGEPFLSNETYTEPLDVTMPASSKSKPVQAQRSKQSSNCPGPQFTFTTKLMRDLKYTCTNLTALFIEYCDIDYKTTNISQFPPQLKKLSLKGSRCFNQPLHSSYLCKIQDHLPDLEYLDVSSCDWFEPASLMPVSKVPKLRELYMCDCMRLTECVAYASLAARYGFRELRVLDARGSPLADSEVSALGWLPRLRELHAAPPAPLPAPTDHAHAWADPLPPFHELDSWEIEEPEYFKVKTSEVPDSPPSEDSNGTKDSQTNSIAEIRELRNTDAVGDRPWGGYERRIIVIQPNANREMVVQLNDDLPNVLAWRPNQAPEAGPSKRPHSDQALDLVKRPRLDDGAAGLDEAAAGDRGSRLGPRRTKDDLIECCINHRNNPCPRPEPQGSRLCLDPGSAAHILTTGGTPRQIRPFFHNHYYDLVTDSAVFRFGRGENEHVVHLGVPPIHESQTRPDRSSLRVLSVTGYRNITDRSLVHLATAAPHLRLVDFSETNVTARGVEMFKAMRPECEVKYNTLVIAMIRTDELQQLFDIQEQMKNIPTVKNLPNEYKNNINRNDFMGLHDMFAQKDRSNDNPIFVGNEKNDNDSRRTSVLNWFKSLFSSTSTTTTEGSVVRVANPITNTEILLKLSLLLDNMNKLLSKANKDGFLTVKINSNNERVKRNVNTTDKITVINNKNTIISNETNTNNSILSGRRSMSYSHFVSPATEVRQKLLLYLEEIFTEIQNKLQPLNNLKVILSDDNHYRIGYLTANIDTLHVNLNKMKQNMDENKHFWDDTKILELFDKLKTADKVLTKLLGTLAVIAPKY